MKINITYSKPLTKKRKRARLIKILKLPVLLGLIACVVVNICCGGKAWSIIAIWSTIMVWNLLIEPDIIEWNRISQFTKLMVETIILLALIEIFLVSGWALNVIIIIAFSSLILAAILLFTDFKKQHSNASPVILLSICSLIGSIIYICIYSSKITWEIIVLASISLTILLVMTIINIDSLKIEFQKLFHLK